MKKISKILGTLLTLTLFILAVYIMLFGAIARKNNKLLNFFGYSYSYVPTDSMQGEYKDSFDAGSLIISKKVDFNKLKINDIIIYQDKTSRDQDILIVHRIVDINDDGTFVTKGDNNSLNDDVKINDDIYQAKVIKSFKLLNAGSNIGSLQIQLLFILIILLTAFAGFQIFNIIKAIKNDKLDQIKEKEKITNDKLREEILKEIEKEKEE